MNRRLPWMLLAVVLIVVGTQSQKLFAEATETSQQQLQVLQQGDAAERERAARLLGVRPGEVDVTAPALLNAMQREQDNRVTVSIRSALIAIGKPAVPHIIAAIHDWPADRVRELVVVLAVIGPDASAALPELREMQQTSDPRLQRCVTFALNSIQPGQASPASQSVGNSSDEIVHVRSAIAGQAADRSTDEPARFTIAGTASPSPVKVQERPQIRQIAATTVSLEEDLQTVPRAPAFPADQELKTEPAHLRDQPTQAVASNAVQSEAPAVTKPAAPLETVQPTSEWWEELQNRAETLQADVVQRVAASRIDWIKVLQWIGLSYTAWVLIFFIVPTLFVEADLWMQRIRRSLALRILLIGLPVIRSLLLLPWLCRSRYATNAWIDSRGDGVVNRFWAGANARRHAGYVATPVLHSGEYRPKATSRDLKWVNRRDGRIVQITGPSGSGKHALCVDIAGKAAAGAISERRSLPVFLQQDMTANESIGAEVRHLLGLTDEESEYYETLLQRIESDFVLPVIDAGKDPDAVRELVDDVRTVVGGCPIVVVAGDKQLNLPAVDLQLEPLTPEAEQLREFMDDYLTPRGLQTELTDRERDTLSNGFERLRIAGRRPVVLLTMFLDDFLRNRVNGSLWSAADSAVTLVQRHVASLLTRAAGTGFTPDELQRDITELARMATAKSFLPLPVRRDAVLKRLEGWNAARRLEFLADELQLLEVDRSENGMVSFRNRHLALRLAAAARCESLDRSESRWKSVLQQLRLTAQESNVEPFALALYDCCLASSALRPGFVLAELGHLAGIAGERVQQELLEQQTTAAVSQLNVADSSVRLDVLKSLRRLAERSEEALAALIDTLNDIDPQVAETAGELLLELGTSVVEPLCERLDHSDLKMRLPVIDLLRKLGPVAQSAVPALLKMLAEENDVARAAVILALAAIAPAELPPLAELLQRETSIMVRAACIEAAGARGDTSDDFVDSITAFLEDPSEPVRLAAVKALGQIGLASVGVVAGLIKAMVAEEDAIRAAAEVSLSQLRGLPDAGTARQTVPGVRHQTSFDSELQAAAA